MRRLLVLGTALVAVFALIATPAFALKGGTETKRWRITVENLTPPGAGAPGSQPLSPAFLAVHSKAVDIWSVGDIASHGVAAIAEDANTAPLVGAVRKMKGVRLAKAGGGGPIASGASTTYTVSSKGTRDRLTLLTMLVNTNDAFTGLDGIRLRDGATFMVRAYDGGSEQNTELKKDIPGPCCGNPFVREPEGNLIRKHRGIKGNGDLTKADYGWTGAVARITIERIS